MNSGGGARSLTSKACCASKTVHHCWSSASVIEPDESQSSSLRTERTWLSPTSMPMQRRSSGSSSTVSTPLPSKSKRLKRKAIPCCRYHWMKSPKRMYEPISMSLHCFPPHFLAAKQR
jgi:hypothetical protein